MIDTNETRDITFIHAVDTEDDIIFQDIFSALGQHATIVVNEPSAAWGGEHGPLTSAMVMGIAKPNETALVYLAGAENFLERLQSDLLEAGLRQHQIVTDFFPGYRA
jgi:ferredoxin-NADP reductase